MSNMSDDALRRLEEGVEKDRTELADKRARLDELGRAMARGESAPSDFAESQSVQQDITALEQRLATQQGVLRVVYAERQKMAAERAAEDALRERRSALEAAVAAANEYARLARQIEETAAHMAGLYTAMREQRDRAQQAALPHVKEEHQRSSISGALASLSPELDRLGEFVNPLGGGGNIDGGNVAGVGDIVARRVARAVERMRDLLESPTTEEG